MTRIRNFGAQRRMVKSLLWLVLACPIPALAAIEITIAQPIAKVLYNGEAGFLYVVGGGGWGAPSCPTAVYVQVSNTLAYRKELFAATLAAQSAGRTVRFRGNCNPTNGNSFDAYYIEVE